MSRALRIDCPHCGESNSLFRVLFHLTGVHLKCRACGKLMRAVETVSGVFLTFLGFALVYGAVFWWLSGVWPPDAWISWSDPALVAGLPLLPGAAGALGMMALARNVGADPAPAERLSSGVFGVAYALALISSVAILLTVWAGGLLLRTGEPMPAVELPDRPGAEVVEDADAWKFAELSGERHTLGELKGKPVFLHYWHPGDVGVVDVLAGIRRLRKERPDVWYVLVGDADEQAVREFAARRGPRLPYVLAEDPLPPALAAGHSGEQATTWLLDAQGRLAFVHTGPARWDTEPVERFLDALR
jgi:uncharacterized protein (DUF983 family)